MLKRSNGNRITGRARGMLPALVLALLSTGAVAAETADERIDRLMGALDDPRLIHVLTTPPVPPGGHQGPQPFDQQPPVAQQDVFGPGGLNCIILGNGQVVCR